MNGLLSESARRRVRIPGAWTVVVLLAAAGSAAGQSTSAQPHCSPVGGTVMTNFLDRSTTLGTATGDLAGAVSASLLGVTWLDDQTAAFRVQHHWVTAAGDTVQFEVAEAVGKLTSPNVFGIVSYPVTIIGGTGVFNGATGLLTNIGAVDLNTGRTVFRYSGEVCRRAPAR